MSTSKSAPSRFRRVVTSLVAVVLAGFLSLGVAAPAHASDNFPGHHHPHPEQNQQ